MTLLKSRIWSLVEVSYDQDAPVLDWYDASMVALILLNVLAVVIESVEEIGQRFAAYFYAFEVFSVAVFTIEYIVKLWACTVELRLFRLLRVLKIGRYSQSVALMAHVVRRKRSDLTVTALLLFVMLVIAASLMYYAEHDAQPEAFGSIPAAMWWGVATFTTVGYGDVYPITPLGRILGSFIAILGIGIFALPAGILASGFSEERERMRTGNSADVCPHCGRALDQDSS